ncbi:MAG: GtrA family protein [Sphingomonas bacterium]|nr:GtrA family protein [Sphingomonas bacterium]
MANAHSPSSIERLWRYYQAGIVNTAFGYGLYALFVALGLNMYLAQIIAHLLGMTFNFFTYSRHAFHDAEVSKSRFILSYAVNYLLGLGALWAASQFIESPYLAGFLAIVIVSLINYLILKNWVFTVRGKD